MTRDTANDVGVWGDKRDRGNADYLERFKVAGEVVDLDALPAFAERDELPTFYRCQDGVLARRRHERAVPELLDEKRKTWHSYPALDELHDARAITRDELFEWFPDVTAADLERGAKQQ